MITKVTKENKALYQALFDEASIRLNESADPGAEEIVITSLDDYFCALSDLMYRPEDVEKLNYKFAILPLDEPFFEIDANTRVITVPSEFKKNGISVKGDQIAEILYFTIDRYYDTIDLADEAIEIYIQCETPASDKNTQYLYKAVHKDITILRNQGKMIFGWTIDDKITSTSGTIKFSVRFVRSEVDSQTGESKINFSLSTLTANVIINPGLDFTFVEGEPTIVPIDNLSIIKNRVKDSVYYDTDVEAPVPEFILNIPADSFGSVVEGDITYLLTDLQDEQYQLIVQAVSDEGVISYEWRRNEEVINGSDIYVKSTDIEWSNDYLYYVKESDNVYTVFDTTGLDPTDEDLPELYIKRNGITVASVGDYYVIAKNRKGIALSSTKSNYVRIPGPGVLSVAVEDLELDTDNNYQVTLNEEGEFELVATGSTDRLGNDAGVGDKITYTWSEEDQTDPIISTAINHVTNNGVSDIYSGEVEEADRKTFDHIIQLQVAASRNGAATSLEDIASQAKKFRITDKAHEPDVELAVVSPIRIGVGETAHLEISASTRDIVSDTITYQWFKLTSDPEDEDELIEGATSNALDVVASTRNDGGSFYCKVTNHVNGTVATFVPNANNFIDVIVS